MSRIGKAPVAIPTGVEVSVADGNIVTVKGKLGELKQSFSADMKVIVNEGEIVVERPSESKTHKAFHGLTRALISNMVEGVSSGYVIEQELVGVGFRANANGQKLELSLGFSHPIVFELPAEVKVTTVSDKGKNPQIKLESTDKQLVGQVAAKIRSLRKPEPYKGKGIRFKGEEVRRKAGKTAGK